MHQRLKIVREAYDLSQAKFASPLSLKQPVYQRYEKGERPIPHGVIELVVEKYAVNADWLIRGKGSAWNPHELESDTFWKRLTILRNSSQIFSGTPRIAAKMLQVDLQQYNSWELGAEKIPNGVIDKIYELVKDHIQKKWWYEGKGQMYTYDPIAEELPTGVEDTPAEYFTSFQEEDLTPAEAQILDEVKQFSDFLKKRPLRPAVKRVLLERLIESIDQALERPPDETPQSGQE